MYVFPAMKGPYEKIKVFIDKFKALGLSGQCNGIRHSLTMLLTNPDVMSEPIAEKMLPSARGVPYHINPSDPEQVAVLKKIINMLFNIEKILLDLEKLSEAGDLTELITHTPRIARSLYSAVNQVYEAIQLINHSNASIQAIFGPQFNQLKQNMGPLLEQLSQFTPNGAMTDQNWGQVLGTAINLLPQERTTPEKVSFSPLGQALFNAPEYFKQLQNLLENGSLLPDPEASISTDDPRRLKQNAKREQDANKFTANLDNLAIKSWSEGLGLEYTAAIARMAGFLKDHTKTLVQIGIPTSKAAYLKFEEALINFKHKLLPAMIDELEALEITLGLKPGLLVEPALDAANTYYSKLIKKVNTKVEKARAEADNLGVKAFLFVTEDDQNKLDLDSKFQVGPKIAHLIDKTFIEQRENRQNVRLDAAKEKRYEVQSIAKAAELFFAKINARPDNLTIQDRQELAVLYQQLQPYMAARDPRLDAEIVGYLNLTEQEKDQWAQRASAPQPEQPFLKTVTEYGLRLTGQSLFDRILKQRVGVTGAINRELATVDTQIDLIKASQDQAKASAYLRMGKKTTIEAISDSNQSPLKPLELNKNLSLKQFNKNISDLDDQLDQGAQAHDAFTAFINTLQEVGKGNKFLIDVNEEGKEQLRKQYAQFQKYISPENELLRQWDKRIVSALMSDKSKGKEDNLAIAEVLDLKEIIAGNMVTMRKRLLQDRELYLQHLKEKSEERPISPILLKPSRDISKGTLLAQANALKLSEHFDNSIQKAIEFLQSNLAAGVVEEIRYVDSSPNLPYQIGANDSSVTVLYKTIVNYFYSLIDSSLQKAIGFFKNNLSTGVVKELQLNDTSPVKPYQLKENDSSQAALYKNVINSLYYLKEAFVGLEKQSGHQYTEDTFSRVLFLGQTGLATALPFKKMVEAFKNVENNPQFTALLQILPSELTGLFTQVKSAASSEMAEAVEKAQTSPQLTALLQTLPTQLTELYEKKDTSFIPKAMHHLQLMLLNLVENTPVEQLEAGYNEFEQNFIRFIQALESVNLARTTATADGALMDAALTTLQKIKAQIHTGVGEINSLLGNQWNAAKDKENKEPVIGVLVELDTYLARYNQPGVKLDDQEKENIKNCYNKLQPYLSQTDRNYYSKELLENSPDYEKVLRKILIQDRTKLVAQIKENKLNKIFHYILSEGTPKIQTIISEINKNILKEAEPPKEQKVKKTDAVKRQQALKKAIEAVKKVPVPSNDSPASRQLGKDKDAIIAALERMVPFLAKVSVSPKKVQELLNTVQGIYAALMNAGAGSRELVIENLQNLRSTRESIILLADEAEFSLGLKPGVLTSALNEQFDKFYEGLITSVKTTYSDQEILSLIVDTNLVSMRVATEEQRLKNLEDTAGSPVTPTREMEIRISRERLAYLTGLKSGKEEDKDKRFEQFKQTKYEKILHEDIRNLVNQKMGVYAYQFFQDVKLLFDERRKSILPDIDDSAFVEEAIRNKLNEVFIELMPPP